MKNDVNALRDALSLIKNECARHGSSCLGCPFRTGDYDCGITGIKMVGDYDYKKKPSYWVIPEIKLLSKPKEEV